MAIANCHIPYCNSIDPLDSQSLDLVLERTDLAHQVRRLVRGDGGRDDSPGDTACAAQGDLAGDVDVGGVLREQDLVSGGRNM